MIIIILEDTLEQRPSGFVQWPLYKAYYEDDDDNWAMLAKSEDRNHFSKNKSTPVVMAAMTVDATAKARNKKSISAIRQPLYMWSHYYADAPYVFVLFYFLPFLLHPLLDNGQYVQMEGG